MPAHKNGKVSFHDLAQMLGDGDRRPHYQSGRIRIEFVNVLPQPRQTFEGLLPLAEDVAAKGFINLPLVARFSKKEFETYLAIINLEWNTDFKVGQFVSTTDEKGLVYYQLLAGERRYRASMILYNEGCEECKRRGPVQKGECFARHFADGLWEVRLCTNASPLIAQYLQLAENTHMAVPPWEEAAAYARLYRLVKVGQPEMTVGKFARYVGRGAETVGRALLYYELPEEIQKAVESKLVSYGIAVELARYQKETECDSEAILAMMVSAITSRMNVETFQKVIKGRLAERQSGQQSLDDMMSAAQLREMEHQAARRAVMSNSVAGLHAQLAYFRKVLALFEAGKLGRDDSPLSHDSTVRLLKELIAQLKQVTPHLRRRARGRRVAPETLCEKAEEVLERAKRYV